MTYDQVINAVKSGKYAYALDYTGMYLFILDKDDDQFPEPIAWDIMLEEYRNACNIPERGRLQLGWWLSTMHPDEAIKRWNTVGPVEIQAMLREWKPEPKISEKYILELHGWKTS